jgi:hypothetical protein
MFETFENSGNIFPESPSSVEFAGILASKKRGEIGKVIQDFGNAVSNTYSWLEALQQPAFRGTPLSFSFEWDEAKNRMVLNPNKFAGQYSGQITPKVVTPRGSGMINDPKRPSDESSWVISFYEGENPMGDVLVREDAKKSYSVYTAASEESSHKLEPNHFRQMGNVPYAGFVLMLAEASLPHKDMAVFQG